MTVNYATGEVLSTITEADVRASVRRVVEHAESIWDEWAWQVENETWEFLGYASWDEMRQGEYASLSSIAAPRAERPELISRFRRAGLTQKQTADTLGLDRRTVGRHDEPTYRSKGTNVPFEPETSAEPVPAEPFRPAESAEPALADLDDTGPNIQPEGGASDADPTDPRGGEGSALTSLPPRPPRTVPQVATAEAAEHENAREAAWALTRAVGRLLQLEHPNMRAGMRRYWAMASEEVSPVQRADVTPDLMRRAAHGLLILADEWD